MWSVGRGRCRLEVCINSMSVSSVLTGADKTLGKDETRQRAALLAGWLHP